MSKALFHKLLTAVISNPEFKTELMGVIQKFNLLSAEELTQLQNMSQAEVDQLSTELDERLNKGHHAGI